MITSRKMVARALRFAGPVRLPRQVSGSELAHALRLLGYSISRQTGSHLRLSCHSPREHHISIPLHIPLRVGTVAAILDDIAQVHSMTLDQLPAMLFQ